MAEHVVGDLCPLDDTLNFVESPMDAQVDSALSVFFHRSAKTIERAKDDWSIFPALILGHTVKLVRAQGERYFIRTEEISKRPEESGAKARMAGRVRGERRGEISAAVIAGRRSKR